MSKNRILWKNLGLNPPLRNLDTRGLDPERHAQLSIALAREMSERWRLQNLENELTKRGVEIGKEMGVEIGKEMGSTEREKEIIRNYIKSKPDATNNEIVTLLGVSLAIVLEVRMEQG